MKALKLATLPVALLATSAYANDIVVVDEPAQTGFVQHSTHQVVDGAKSLFKKATNPGAISAEIGTFGYGGHITWGVNKKVDLEAGWNGGKPDFDIDIDEDSIINWKNVFGDNLKKVDQAKLTFKADMNTPYLGVKLRPFGNNFNVGTGVIWNKNQYTVGVTASKDFDYTVKKTGETIKFSANESVEVSAEQAHTLAPYLTVGFAPSINKRWGLFGEVGAAYTGGLETTVKTSSSTDDIKKIADDLRQEVADANLAWYPIVKAGVTVRF